MSDGFYKMLGEMTATAVILLPVTLAIFGLHWAGVITFDQARAAFIGALATGGSLLVWIPMLIRIIGREAE